MNTLSFKTISAKKESVDKNWFIVDADSKVLGRVASEVAKVIRGKHKPSFTPHINCGDNVIVINAEKIRFTGDKMNSKEYITHVYECFSHVYYYFRTVYILFVSQNYRKKW